MNEQGDICSPKRRIRRHLRIFALAASCITLGILGTILSAWGFAAWHATQLNPWTRATILENLGNRTRIPVSLVVAESEIATEQRWQVGDFRVNWLDVPTRDDTVQPPDWAQQGLRDAQSAVVTDIAIGWPYRSLRSRELRTQVPGKFSYEFAKRSPRLPLGWTGGKEVVLPLVPVWPGFLFNTLLIATTIFAIVLACTRFRSALRRRHHRCPTCNYNCRDLHSPTCPECGKPHGIHTPATNPHRPTDSPSGPEGATGCSHG